MVDLKLLFNHPVINKQVLMRRRCRQVTCVSGLVKKIKSYEIDHIEGDQLEQILSKFKKIAIVVIVVLVVICVAIGISLSRGYFGNKKEVAAAAPANPTKPLPPSPSKLRVFKKAAVCADGAPCAEIGMNILKKNGSAVDAAISTMFCNGIYTMQSMGLGGGFLMTIYVRATKTAYTLNARETAPSRADPTLYKDDYKKSQTGPLSIAVPGELRGYWEAHRRFGRLRWEEIVQPSIDFCEKGYNISNHQFTSFAKNDIKDDPNFNEWFRFPNGSFRPEGSKVIPKKLCETLKVIAAEGGDALYNGSLAAKFAQDLAEMKSLVTAEDLKNYSPQWLTPVQVQFKNGDQLHSIKPPGSGILLAFMMNILDGYGFTPESIHELDDRIITYQRIIEAFKFAYAKRTELGDTNFVNIDELMRNLTSDEYAEYIRQKISDNSTSTNPEDYGAEFYNQEDHGTAHISVLAENGDAVSVTSSINIYFGAGLTSKQTGIIPNSVIDDFSFPYFKNYFGLPGSPNNALVPGKRPLSSMTPTVVTDANGDVKLVIGASGGTKITTSIALVIMRTLWFGQNIKEAVDAPRIHHQLFPMEVVYEYGVLQQELDGLKRIGHNLTLFNGGSIICALFNRTGTIFANADYRKGGDVYGID